MSENIVKDYKQISNAIIDIDDTFSAVQTAIREQLRETYEKEVNRIDSLREKNKKAYDERIKQIRSEYEAKIKAIDDELKALDRAAEDEDKLNRINALQEALAYETDASKRYFIERDLAEAQAEYARDVKRRKLEDQKEVLQDAKEKEEEKAKAAYEAQEDILAKQKETAKKSYESAISYKELERQTKLKIEESTQKDILALLDKYNPQFLAKGTSLADQMGAVWKSKLEGVMNSVLYDTNTQQMIAYETNMAYQKYMMANLSTDPKTISEASSYKALYEALKTATVSNGMISIYINGKKKTSSTIKTQEDFNNFIASLKITK